MDNMLKRIEEIGIVPVVKIERAQDAVKLAKALCDGGLPCAEVTFRTSAAADAIRQITEAFPEMLVGAGTVLTVEQADAAIESGAHFIVSPGLNPIVVKHCINKGCPIIPGVATPSEVEHALSFGLKAVKFFPAENAGGLSMIKAMSAPYSNIKFMPTGGINLENLTRYLDFNKVIACGGSWMVKPELINAGDFETIKNLANQAVEQMLGFSVAHVGINQSDDNNAGSTADRFVKLFGFEKKEGSSSVFVGTSLEIMKNMGFGTNGHIAIKTNYINRAMAYLKRFGVQFNMESAKYDQKGKLKAIYLQEEVGGFALHLLQK
jgi:2-dehydro-3-deoxyphosphogluconate aldolase/(4S)-4-hydroxy-2-oxoglutarate aldolase